MEDRDDREEDVMVTVGQDDQVVVADQDDRGVMQVVMAATVAMTAVGEVGAIAVIARPVNAKCSASHALAPL